MEEGQQNIVSSFPPPPPFYKLYGLDGIVPPPPPSPVEGNYSMFGKTYTTQDILPTLEEGGRRQLYPKENINHIGELKKLNRSLNMKYIELLTFLIENPEQCQTKVEDIELILINMHHLLNSYRPHQSRQTLITLLENQIQNRKKQIQSTDLGINEVTNMFENCINILKSQ